jgi:hypothetical protein
MKITFSRIGEKRYRTEIERDDCVRVQVPAYDRTSTIPHDLSHYVVERELGLRRGFWGSVADGALFSGMVVLDGRQQPNAAARSKELIKANHENAIEAEALVRSFIEVIERGLKPDSVAAQARLAQRWMPQHPDARALTSAHIQQVCAALAAAQDRWQRLAPGGSFTVDWPARPKRRRRSRPKDRRYVAEG